MWGDLSIMNEISRGEFIAFEGIDGSGKSTQIRNLLNRLNDYGIRCYETKEPTDSPIGSLIHQIMTGRISADNRVIASLFVADRVDHLLNKTDGICQKIDNGITVITDRYYFSSYAYHSVDMEMDWVIQANSISADILRPTVTVFLDVPVKKALERIERERFHVELFEKEERLRKVRDKYFEAFEKLKSEENIVIVDSSGSIEEVFENIWNSISQFLIL
ncbi:UNVERIFIED_CONTAM: dTMP kinase [Acetivibrio alkalicellulosi]